VSIEEITPEQISLNEDKNQVLKKGINKGTKKIEGKGEEESLSLSKLEKNQNFRIVLNNKNFKKNDKASFTLRVDIQEKVFKSNLRVKENVPSNIKEI
jgi:hypothetical protein